LNHKGRAAQRNREEEIIRLQSKVFISETDSVNLPVVVPLWFFLNHKGTEAQRNREEEIIALLR